MSTVVGVDGTRDGWVAIRLSDEVVQAGASYAEFGHLLTAEADATVVAVDMPIGIPTAEGWPRPADIAARAMIGPLRSSVFVVPPVEALEAASHAEAVVLCRNAGVAALSQQAYALRHKIYEVARYVSDLRIREIHPEVTFAAMAGGPLQYSKRSWNGFHERLALLTQAGLAIPDDIGHLGRAAVDDVLDATAAAWSANRIAMGTAESLPRGAAATDSAIWY